MAFHKIDLKQWPLVFIDISPGSPTDEEFTAYLDDLIKLLGTGGKRAMVVDCTKSSNLSRQHRRAQAAYLKDYSELIEEKIVGMAMIIQSPVIRTILSAIIWIEPMSCPYKVFSTRKEGEAWCRELLALAKE